MSDQFIKLENVYFSYRKDWDKNALKNINLSIKKGEHVAVIGKNGAGKSTLAQLMNGIIKPSVGKVLINEMNTNDESEIWDIRKNIGMVFQNPDNQIIGTTLYEEVAFGLENIGVDPDVIDNIVTENLRRVGLIEFINSPANCLSGGQKQKLAIASVLAMDPQCIIFDEAMSMIDAFERKELMAIVKELNKNQGLTIINITHNHQELLESERVVLIDDGEIVKDERLTDFFDNIKDSIHYQVGIPEITELFYQLNQDGIDIPINVTDVDKACEILYKKLLDAKRKL